MRSVLLKKQKLMRLNYEKELRKHLSRARYGKTELVIVCDHLNPEFNIGKIFRSADAFSVREVILIGTDYFDPGPAKGSFRNVKARHFNNFHECYQALTKEEYHVFGLCPHAKILIHQYDIPRKSAFILGNEHDGLSFSSKDYPSITNLKIPQYGQVESLNVSVAATLSMYEYVRQNLES